ncbi:MAG TPA: tetratricopeptide repeat protein [Verrucomicrobiae bacterium]
MWTQARCAPLLVILRVLSTFSANMCAAQRGTVGVTMLLLALFASVMAAERKPTPPAQAPDVVALAERGKKSVVVVTHYGRDGKQDGVGAGFVVAADGLIATCLHVIGEARPISIQLADGRRFDATEVFASDRKLDLAVVRIAATNLPVLRLGDSDALQQGAPVVAMGNPIGLEHSIVQGVVSAKRDFDGIEMIQLAIPIEPGNSGGPLLDARGRVQGLLNMKSALTANLGFAVPANALKTLLDRPNPVPMARWLTLGALSPTEWKPMNGARWSRKAGRIQVEGAGEGFGGRSLCLWQKETPAAPYEVAVTVKLDDESGAAGLAFASDGGDVHYGFYPTAGQMRLTRFDGPTVFSWTILKEFKTPHYKAGDWNTIAVRVETNRIAGYVNGELVMESSDTTLRSGKVGLAKFRDTKAQFKNFHVGKESVKSGPVVTWPRVTNTTARSEADLLSEFQAIGGAGSGALLEHARQLDKEANRLRRVAATVHARAVEAEMLQALDGPENKIDLFHAALLVAKLDNAELDVEAYRSELARMANELKQQLAANAGETNKVAALTKFLFTEQGFHGSRTDFYNRANSYMNEVMDDREGLPITLAVLWLELARQIGLTNVAGVPLPTRFMVRFQPRGGAEQIIDVFDNGKVLTRSDAVELVAENVDQIGEEAFAPAKKRDIITRMLRNLLGIVQRTGSATEAMRYLDVIVALNPDSASDRLQRARVQVQRGENAAAKEDLRWVLDHESPGIDLERLTELYRSL